MIKKPRKHRIFPIFTRFSYHGDNRTRTCDLLHVKQMLSQLSYVSMRIF